MSNKTAKPTPFHASRKQLGWALELLSPSFPQTKQAPKEQPVRKAPRARLVRPGEWEQLGLLVLPVLLVLQALLVPLVLAAALDRLVRRVA